MGIPGVQITDQLSGINIMTKERRSHREEKKKAAMTPKEKKAAKKLKRRPGILCSMTGLIKFNRADHLTPHGWISAKDIDFRKCADEHRYRGVHRSVCHLHSVHTLGSVFNPAVVAFTHASLTLWLHDHAHFVTLAVFVGFTFDEMIGIFTFDWLA